MGHVAGLFHEHQRPDAWAYVEIRWENMEDWERIKRRITINRDGDFGSTSRFADRFARMYVVLISGLLPVRC